MSSVCRLSPNSQYCLSQQLSDFASSSCCVSSDCWSRMSDSSQGTEPASNARSRTVNFMLSLLEMCNKMIKSLTALPQDSAEPSPEIGCDFKGALVAFSCGCECPCRSCQPKASSEAGDCGWQPDAATPAYAVRQTNQHQPTERHGGPDRRLGRSRVFWCKKASRNSAQGKKPALTAAKEVSPGCSVEVQQPPGSSEDRPLLQGSGVPRWNQIEYLDFRRKIATQVFEPMHDPGLHRHMVVLDCRWKLQEKLSSFRPPLYRPY